MCFAMLVAAPFVGGAVGVLLVIAAAFVVIDAIVPLPMRPEAEAEERFARAARRRGRRRSELDLIDDAAGASAPTAAARTAGSRCGWPRRAGSSCRRCPSTGSAATTCCAPGTTASRSRATTAEWKSRRRGPSCA